MIGTAMRYYFVYRQWLHDIWTGPFGLAVDSEDSVQFKSFTESTETPRGRQSHYLLLLSGESRPSAKHNKNSKLPFDKSIVIDLISSVPLRNKI